MTQNPTGADKTIADQTDHAVDPKLLEILVCPQTKAPLVYDGEAGELLCKKSRLAYPIRDGVPIMLVDEARALDDGEVERL